MLKRNDIYVCLIVSIVIHIILAVSLFGVRRRAAFMSVPIDVSFYYSPQTVTASDVQPDIKEVDDKGVFEQVEVDEHIDEQIDKKNVKEDIVINKKKPSKKQSDKIKKQANKKKSVKKTKNIAKVENIQSQSDKSVAEMTSPYDGIHFDNHNFKYQYYIGQIVRKIGQQWKWAQSYAKLRVLVYFKIYKDGTTSDISVKESSGNSEFDRYALDTIRRASPFADLPEDYSEDSLGVYFEFKFRD